MCCGLSPSIEQFDSDFFFKCEKYDVLGNIPKLLVFTSTQPSDVM